MKSMKTMSTLMLMGLSLAVILGGFPAATLGAEAKFVGVKGCKTCHKKEKQGEQVKIWEKSDHSKAYATLGKPEAKKAAAKVGVNGDPQKAAECLVCHTTGFGASAASFDKKFKVTDGVQCESCHGAGSLYKKKKVMKKIWEERGADRKGDSATAKETGMLIAGEETCKQCHVKEVSVGGKTYKNPSFKEFSYKERFDKMKHPVPK